MGFWHGKVIADPVCGSDLPRDGARERGAALFEDDFDRRYLLDRIEEAAETYQARFYLFCLMETELR